MKIILKVVIKKKRQEIHWSTLNTHWSCLKAILHFTLAATVRLLVMDV